MNECSARGYSVVYFFHLEWSNTTIVENYRKIMFQIEDTILKKEQEGFEKTNKLRKFKNQKSLSHIPFAFR